MTFDLNKHTARLLKQEPFFAALSRKIDKRSSTAIPTAGVRVNPETGHFEMLYNPEFFESISDKHKQGVLMHEFYHLVFEHVTGRLPAEGMSKIWNQATDLSINSHLIDMLPKGALIPGQGYFEEFPVGRTADEYLLLLQKKQEENEENQENGEGGEGEGDPGTWDDHSGWGETDNTTNEIAKERLKEAVKKAVQEASSDGSWGTVTQSLKQQIIDSVTTKVDWRKVLRYFIKTSQKANKRSTIKKINRRYAYVHPGKKVQRQAKIAIAIDQSGSVSNDMLSSFFAELNNLAKLAEFTIIPFDHEVAEDKVYIWKKGEKRKRERVLTGGTCFNAPTDYVNNNSFDGLIVLTDMYAPKPKRCNVQRMWMTTPECAAHPYFQTKERVIVVD
jgi:predicted metal-dependent peptidase